MEVELNGRGKLVRVMSVRGWARLTPAQHIEVVAFRQ
jgi:hypothetical protein